MDAKRSGIIALLFIISLPGFTQTPGKDAMNSFALYSKSKEFSEIEKAKKFIDNAYKTHPDSMSARTNLTRAMIYSTLSFVDQNRKLAYVKDPIDEAGFSLKRVLNSKYRQYHEPEISYCKKQLALAFLKRANKEIAAVNYHAALRSFKMVDSLSAGDISVKHNLALINERLGNIAQARAYYEQLTADKEHALPEYFLALSNLYESSGSFKKSLEILNKGRQLFPGNRDILFKEINTYADNGMYEAITPLIDDAINADPENVNLNYLAGFSYDFTGNVALAEKYYKRTLELEPNNYDGNYSLGLLYLNSYLKNKKGESLIDAKSYLRKAGEINPNAINVLKSLAILYKNTGETLLLERVNNKLNQIILNN